MMQQAQTVMAAADVADEDLRCYSDMHKECYGFRPRYTPTKQDYADLANRYDAIQEENRAQEAAELKRLEEQHGRTFKSWCEYYDWDIARMLAEVEQEQAAKEAARLEKAALSKPGARATIDAWEHGD